MFENEGAGSGDAGGWGFWDYELDHADSTWKLKAMPLRYEYGPANIDETSSGSFTRAELASLASAAATGQTAFNNAMAATGQSSWWSTIVSAAQSASVPTADAPPNAFRKLFLHVPMSYAD